MRVTRVMRGSRQSISRTGIPPLPAPTWNRWAMFSSQGFAACGVAVPERYAASGKTPLAGSRSLEGQQHRVVAGADREQRADRSAVLEMQHAGQARKILFLLQFVAQSQAARAFRLAQGRG